MSYLATLKRDGDKYILPDGCFVDDDKSAIGDLLGFCGCGAHQTALRYVRDVMRLINQKPPETDLRRPNMAFYDAKQKRISEFFHADTGAEYLAYYLLDDKQLIEHGTSVPGWLTELGENVLIDLEAMNLD